MITLLLRVLRLLPVLVGGDHHFALENLALQQLAVYKRTANGPKLQRTDRLPWVWLSRVWPPAGSSCEAPRVEHSLAVPR
jgi:hypothetical protein